jgi:hypothetical protein
MTMMTRPRPKPRRERIRNIYKSIIRDYMVAEQWRATCDRHDKWCQCPYCSYYNKQWQYWTESRLYDDSLSNGEYPATMPQTESQLLKVIQHSGHPKLKSRKTVRRCLHEMVEDSILYRYRYHPDVRGPKNQKFYIFPLESMPSRDVLLMFDISKQMARRVILPDNVNSS